MHRLGLVPNPTVALERRHKSWQLVHVTPRATDLGLTHCDLLLSAHELLVDVVAE